MDVDERLVILRNALVGTEALFRDRPLLTHVRFTAIEATPTGVSLHFEQLSSRGFVTLPKQYNTQGCAWEDLHLRPGSIDFQPDGCPFALPSFHTDPGVVAKLVSFAERCGEPITMSSVLDCAPADAKAVVHDRFTKALARYSRLTTFLYSLEKR